MNILHNDIKPENIVYSHDGRLMLVDLDFITDSGQKVNWLCGILGYIPPEDIVEYTKTRYITLQKSRDIWSLGCTLYFCATGGSDIVTCYDTGYKPDDDMEYIRSLTDMIIMGKLEKIQDKMIHRVIREMLYIDPKSRCIKL